MPGLAGLGSWAFDSIFDGEERELGIFVDRVVYKSVTYMKLNIFLSFR